MAFVQADIDALDAAYKRGAQSVTTSDGKSVSFRSIDEYIKLRKLLTAEVNGTSRRPASYSVASHSKARS